jgi:hypothetical protein
MTEIQICNECIVDSDFEAFATVTHSEETIFCDVCGGEFWTLNVAEFGDPADRIEQAIIEDIVRNQQAIQTVIDAEKAKAAG